MQILSAFGGGLFVIPLATFLLACYSAYRGVKAQKSGSTKQDGTKGTRESDEKVSFLRTGGGVFSVILFLATIVIVLAMIAER